MPNGGIRIGRWQYWRSPTQPISHEKRDILPFKSQLSYEARKELSKAIKKAEKAVAEAEARISELENGIAVIEAKLATPEGASDASLYGEYSALKKELSDAMDLWTERTMELEELNTQDS